MVPFLEYSPAKAVGVSAESIFKKYKDSDTWNQAFLLVLC